MTEAKTETKKEEKPAKMTPGQELREKRGLLGVLRKDIETQTAILKNKYNEDMAATLAVRQKGIKALKEKADEEKVAHKTAYDRSREAAISRYELALAEITKEQGDSLAKAHSLKEGEYQRINAEVANASEPFLTAHREESSELTKKYEKEETEHRRAGETAVTDLQEEIRALEVEVAKRAEKHKEIQAGKKPVEAATT